MYELNQSPGRTVWANGRQYLFFSGYSYLGMGHVEEFTNLVKEGIDKFGLLHPSSRISNTQLPIYETFENILSRIVGSEETVTFSSGYLAGRAVVDLVTKHNKHVYCAPNTHPAIQCGTPLIGDDWKNQLVKTINQSPNNSFILFMDSVNPLTASVANFSFLHELDSDKHLTCIIDDSHGIGLLGPIGNGISHLVPELPNVEAVIVYSLSKAFHPNGGAISCSKRIAGYLTNSPYYTGATAISPAMAYAFVHGQHLYLRQLKKLQDNISAFIQVTSDIGGICFYPQLPVFVLKSEWEAAFFDAQNIIISSFAYPDPSGNKVNRIVLNALHTRQDLFKLSCVLNQLSK
jgi:7-keto-8-aminopelargonate synthetase-like enzyme